MFVDGFVQSVAVWQTCLRNSKIAIVATQLRILIKKSSAQINLTAAFSINLLNLRFDVYHTFIFGLLKPAATVRIGRGEKNASG